MQNKNLIIFWFISGFGCYTSINVEVFFLPGICIKFCISKKTFCHQDDDSSKLNFTFVTLRLKFKIFQISKIRKHKNLKFILRTPPLHTF